MDSAYCLLASLILARGRAGGNDLIEIGEERSHARVCNVAKLHDTGSPTFFVSRGDRGKQDRPGVAARLRVDKVISRRVRKYLDRVGLDAHAGCRKASSAVWQPTLAAVCCEDDRFTMRQIRNVWWV